MNDKDQRLIWENYISRHAIGEDDIDYENMSVEQLKGMSREKAEEGLKKLAQVDHYLQQADFMSGDERRRRDRVRSIMKILRDVIDPPPPAPTDNELEDRAAQRQQQMQVRRMIVPTKQEFNRRGTFEKIASKYPSIGRYEGTGFMSNDGVIPAPLQRLIVQHYLENGEELPDEDAINRMINALVHRNELAQKGD